MIFSTIFTVSLSSIMFKLISNKQTFNSQLVYRPYGVDVTKDRSQDLNSIHSIKE